MDFCYLSIWFIWIFDYFCEFIERVGDQVKMNADKLKRLQMQVRIGGKGTPRRKKKIVHQTAATDDKKLQSSLKKLSVNTIPGIEEVNMIKEDGTVLHFNNPKAQASLAANTFAITGQCEQKQVITRFFRILFRKSDFIDVVWNDWCIFRLLKCCRES